METVTEKYDRIRPLIKDGDLILFRGTGILAKIIQNCDKSYYNHIGIIIEKLGALYIIDANGNGVQADRLSYRVSKYKGGDFTIVHPLCDREDIDFELRRILKRSDEKTIKYDFWNGFKELMNRKFNSNFKVELDERHDICSDFVSEYQLNLGLLNKDFINVRISFPQDTIRYKTDLVEIIN